VLGGSGPGTLRAGVASIPREPQKQGLTGDRLSAVLEGARPFWSRNWQHRKTSHPLSPLNQDTLNVRGRGRPRNQRGVACRLEPRITVCVMQIRDHVGRIEQSNEVLRKISKRIDLQLGLAEPDRACFGNPEGRAYDSNVNVGQIRWVGVSGQSSSPLDLRGRRADHERPREERADETIKIIVALPGHELPSHSQQRFLEMVEQRSRSCCERGYLRKRESWRGLVCAHRCKNCVAAGHGRPLCLRYQLWKVCCGASGISRWRPQGLSQL